MHVPYACYHGHEAVHGGAEVRDRARAPGDHLHRGLGVPERRRADARAIDTRVGAEVGCFGASNMCALRARPADKGVASD